ncbi:MAG: hypothetical protein IE931_06805 [Sphingobacteriales bacterium]|nr:hypothetical protein [Sphingobacteriales bacterium]
MVYCGWICWYKANKDDSLECCRKTDIYNNTPPDWQQNVSVNNSNQLDMSSTNALLLQLIDKVQNQQVSLNLRMLEEEQAKRVKIKSDASV